MYPKNLYKRSKYLGLLSLILGVLYASQASAWSDCEGDWRITDDVVQCVYLLNDTSDVITINSWGNYRGGGDHGDDFDANDDFDSGAVHVPPGNYYAVGGIDDQGWGIFEYGDKKFRGEIVINGHTMYSLYELAEVRAGIVQDFEFSMYDADGWHDDETYHDFEANGKTYRVTVTDSGGDILHSFAYDRVFTFQEINGIGGSVVGNMGYVPSDTSADVNKVNVMNYNTFLLIGPTGIVLDAVHPVPEDDKIGKPDYHERAKAIWYDSHRIFKNVDILVLNELASQDLHSPDAEDLATGDYLCCGPDKPFRDRTRLLNGEPTVSGLTGPTETGGVVIMSRYENSLVDGAEYHNEFGECGGGDCSMLKGFLSVRFIKPGPNGENKSYFIVGTHAQSDAEYSGERASQFNQMRETSENRALPGEPIIYAGDFNVEDNEYSSMETNLNASYYADKKVVWPYGIGLEYSDDWESNKWPLGIKKRYDYILHSNARPQPTNVSWRYLPIRSDARNWKNRGGGGYDGIGTDLSDHHAVLSELDYTTQNQSSNDGVLPTLFWQTMMAY